MSELNLGVKSPRVTLKKRRTEGGLAGEKKSINCRGGVGPDHAISRGGFFKAKISIDSVRMNFGVNSELLIPLSSESLCSKDLSAAVRQST